MACSGATIHPFLPIQVRLVISKEFIPRLLFQGVRFIEYATGRELTPIQPERGDSGPGGPSDSYIHKLWINPLSKIVKSSRQLSSGSYIIHR